METPKLISHLKELTNLTFREVESSNIYLVSYFERNRTMYIIFKDKKGNDPQWVYQYKVNPFAYKAFLAAPSKGEFFTENIRDHVICKSKITY